MLCLFGRFFLLLPVISLPREPKSLSVVALFHHKISFKLAFLIRVFSCNKIPGIFCFRSAQGFTDISILNVLQIYDVVSEYFLRLFVIP